MRFLRTMEAFNATHVGPPSWTMTERNVQDLTRGKVHTEIGSQGNLNASKPAPPQWTVQPRWKSDKPQGHWVPAPGNYKNPTTLTRSHPTIPCGARGWTWGGGERKTFGNGPKTPSPDAYKDDRKDAAMNKEPSWLLAGRWKDPEVKQDSPELKNTQGMRVKGGVSKSPEWQFLARPESALIPSKSIREQPGPGAHRPNYGGIGESIAPLARIKKSPSFGFGNCPRFPKPPETAHVL